MLIIHMFACLSDNYGFLIQDQATGKVAAIDTPDAEQIMTEAKTLGWSIDQIWNTHWHPDHAGGNQAIETATGAIALGPSEVSAKISPLSHIVEPGDSVTLGESRARVIDVGGHTLGHIAYYFEADAVVFVGDAMFALGCGRLFEGSASQAWDSLMRLMALPDETMVYCAHEYTAANARFSATLEMDNPALTNRLAEIAALRAKNLPTIPTTIGLERATNPFVRANLASLRQAVGASPHAPAYEVFGQIRLLKDHF
ncbi:hydroxyacylglutathione hydrolase [Candidatus Phycosocius spiralis]|uniref:Hydroxyacylglutathione hydrolase n=1 Tax=Candidatus Phycosocius spiralis TaxID=2815099 RepID=A0ABQ4PVG2_9PROT|nr:hydroxyacylglutathione hydrolase [Candidatus Phycosocius spiralis]GIU66972.1 hydroxyacylglutathione hydrolase [Candidatus Phycosocius spiralis]